MSMAARFIRDFSSKPPKEINFNSPGNQCLNILEALEHAADLLTTSGKETTVLRAINTLDKYWPRVWVWLAALSKGFLNTPPPLTSFGLETTQRFMQVAKI
ncbi:hypothetical protein V5O48_019417, partial [Marasmius crinis-equi]